ncbi:MAG: carbohydrate binding family 9 domain-containing protein, partial [Bacteroidota bacterium]
MPYPTLNLTRCSSFIVFFVLLFHPLTAQQIFPPPTERLTLRAQRVEGKAVELDGTLNEKAWRNAPKITGFTQREPVQGARASQDTEVRVLFDEDFLYVGAICRDSLVNRNRLRVRNLQRDFSGYGNDRFSIALDGLLDQRNAVGFEVTPYGSQRELQVIDGAEFDANENWDALWFARTTIADSGWVAEIAIPWKTLRYRKDSKEMLISFNRNIRRNNEITTWPAYPRIFSHFRMAYAAR